MKTMDSAPPEALGARRELRELERGGVLEGSLRLVLYNIGVYFARVFIPPKGEITLCMGFELSNFVGLFG
jgi:hypothetical protein